MASTTQRATHGPIVAAVGATGGVAALRVARLLAKRRGIPLIVASVVEPPPVYDVGARRILFVPWTIDAELDARRELIRERLLRMARSASSDTALGEVPVEVTYGDAAHEVGRIATDEHASLIVMGLGPHSIGRRLLSTGTPWQTARHATCPVLAVSERARDLPRQAVIATDFSAESIHAARHALTLLADGAVVHIVHAWSRFETVFPVSELTKLNEDYAASLPERFARFRAALGHSGSFVFHTTAVEGKPADVVLSLAHARRADLVVAGTHGYGMLERWVLGSTSTALLRGSECSVLLVPSPGASERAHLTRHMTGTSRMRDVADWDEELRAFVERNRERRTRLEIDDVAIGAQVQESGYPLVGASYDPHDHHVALMFGGGATGRAHLTRSLGGVRSVAVSSGSHDEDVALCIESDEGSALLTFVERDAPAQAPSNA